MLGLLADFSSLSGSPRQRESEASSGQDRKPHDDSSEGGSYASSTGAGASLAGGDVAIATKGGTEKRFEDNYPGAASGASPVELTPDVGTTSSAVRPSRPAAVEARTPK